MPGKIPSKIKVSPLRIAILTIFAIMGSLAIRSFLVSRTVPSMPFYTDFDSAITNSIPRYASIKTVPTNLPTVDVIVYEVQEGDNIFSIADSYGIRPETILWSNYDVMHDDPRTMSPGDKLNILPVDGVYYRFKQGESLIDIALELNTSVEAIVHWPGNKFDPYKLDPENPYIADGTWLVIPGGSLPLPPTPPWHRLLIPEGINVGACERNEGGAVGDGIFVWPTTETYLTGSDWNPPTHNGIDIGGEEGNPVYAADSGVAVYAGWSDSGLGFLITIDHGGGLQTSYAHLAGVGVVCGQGVKKGLQIGNLGNTGNSPEPHLYFEVTQNGTKVNPWFFLSP